MAKVVKIIPVKPADVVEGVPKKIKKRVCAYCRVSTDSEEQKESYENQLNHYTRYIQSNPDWEFVDIYADEGISGTNTKNRTEFKRMIQDAREGKIDLILTKSISRFSRNTMDLLKYVRELRSKGIAVLFEKENINTLDSAGEVFLTIFSSIAQDESRNISENSRWGIVKGFQNGKVFCNTTRFLGYDKDEDGELIINEEEAKIVRRIYQEYLEGKSYQAIANGLEADGIKTATGNTKWWDSTITGILTNEKYYGALLQQKTITVDFLTHKRVKNIGQERQFFIEENHEPIISKEIFDKVQKEKERRALLKGNVKGERKKYSSKYAFSGKVYCSKCGNTHKRRTWNSNNTSRKVVWQCKTYINEGKDACNAKAVDEQVLQDAFVRVFNRMKADKDGFIETLHDNIEKVLAKRAGATAIQDIESKMEQLKSDLRGLVQLQVRGQIDEEVYNEEQSRMSQELDELRKRRLELDKEQHGKEQYKQRVQEIIQTIQSKQGLLEKFDDDIFNALVEKIEVLSPAHFVFILKSGMKVEETF
ncbi:recombinase family protein [Aneurinibacillus aneurinilyticus]|jgi:DNA invertase Pin-like site-specific DNA recombinase|uniref:recombinase family protein n=1 Tax=Aneurinibacillus aneurinilyticus TaxID=1391 RepID=UPI0023F98B9E|nr:recombinase family protein [Aneurinibacillus aneurinilyticus]MCI1693310.1 recombinase family protein [Aneurinibacillus aneurinilyticus]